MVLIGIAVVLIETIMGLTVYLLGSVGVMLSVGWAYNTYEW